MSDTGRSEDIKQLYRDLEKERDPERRDSIKRTIHMIKNETGAIRSMREALIRAHRSGDKREIADVHDYIKNKSKYGSDRHI